LEAQRACLDMAAQAIRSLPGVVFELGLGNGRTYDHLRQCLPERDIFVFEREVRAHPDCIPDDDHLILGDLKATLPSILPRFSEGVALVHSDIGTGDAERNQRLAAWIAATIPGFLIPGAWIVADQALNTPNLVPQALPEGIASDRYFVYRKAIT
jgi:hypothetical protein